MSHQRRLICSLYRVILKKAQVLDQNPHIKAFLFRPGLGTNQNLFTADVAFNQMFAKVTGQSALYYLPPTSRCSLPLESTLEIQQDTKEPSQNQTIVGHQQQQPIVVDDRRQSVLENLFPTAFSENSLFNIFKSCFHLCKNIDSNMSSVMIDVALKTVKEINRCMSGYQIVQSEIAELEKDIDRLPAEVKERINLFNFALNSINTSDNKIVDQLKSGIFLVSHPLLCSHTFHKTVILITNYSPEAGASGVIINIPTGEKLESQCSASKAWRDLPLYSGGPSSSSLVRLSFLGNKLRVDHSFVVPKESWEPHAAQNRLANNRLFVGVCKWEKKQLEKEISQGNWITCSLSRETIFAHFGITSDERESDLLQSKYWGFVLKSLGGDFAHWQKLDLAEFRSEFDKSASDSEETSGDDYEATETEEF